MMSLVDTPSWLWNDGRDFTVKSTYDAHLSLPSEPRDGLWEVIHKFRGLQRVVTCRALVSRIQQQSVGGSVCLRCNDWSLSLVGCLKINVDGARRAIDGVASCGVSSEIQMGFGLLDSRSLLDVASC
ncbi:hypothetical protein V6N11_050398 [Hibiscus sabdariffa]|uniref:Uncharacterized protein n=1 Tax=Hibiscus sabdariffa TaxID=183260 RepID=A0ABR2T9Q4_9ROSI